MASCCISSRSACPTCIEYQNADYARRYVEFVARVRQEEQRRTPGQRGVTLAVARYLHKLMAYKDEYEVARLHLDAAVRAADRGEVGRPDQAVLASAPAAPARARPPEEAPARHVVRAGLQGPAGDEGAPRDARSTSSATRRSAVSSVSSSASTAG